MTEAGRELQCETPRCRGRTITQFLKAIYPVRGGVRGGAGGSPWKRVAKWTTSGYGVQCLRHSEIGALVEAIRSLFKASAAVCGG